MIVTTYTCDKCGHEQNDNSQMCDIGISVKFCREYYSGQKDLTHKQLWCRNCVIEKGIFPPGKNEQDKKVAPPTPPNLEDILREIIREEMEG